MKKYIVSAFLVAPLLVFAQGFDRDLYFGLQNDPDVSKLQELLADENIYSGPITGNFFSLTLRGVKSFQQREQITPAAGYFGPVTRAKANELLGTALHDEQQQAIAETGTTTPSVPPTNSNIALMTSLLEQIKLLQQQIVLLQQTNTYASTSTPPSIPSATPAVPATPATPSSGNETTAIPATPAVPAQPNSPPPVTPPPASQPAITYTLNQASHYHFTADRLINNTNIAYEFGYITPTALNTSVDEVKVSIGGNMNDADVALIYLNDPRYSMPDYNGSNLDAVKEQRTNGQYAAVVNGVADIHLNPIYESISQTFPEIVIILNPSSVGKWTEISNIDFYNNGTKLAETVTITR